MIVLSEKSLGLIKAESAKPHIHSAVADKTLSAGNFSQELAASLAEDARVDGTGATMIPQIVSLIAQLIGNVEPAKVDVAAVKVAAVAK